MTLFNMILCFVKLNEDMYLRAKANCPINFELVTSGIEAIIQRNSLLGSGTECLDG